jgi:hypothetical protein
LVKLVAKSSLAVVNGDTTAQDKAVTFPADARCAAQGARCAGNPYDAHTLQACIDQATRVSGVAPQEACAEPGYKGHGCNTNTFKVWVSGAKRGVSEVIQRKLKRRNAVEPMIAQLKSDGRLARNFLKGIEGDAMNALLCGAGHNIRKILRKLRLFAPFVGSRYSSYLRSCCLPPCVHRSQRPKFNSALHWTNHENRKRGFSEATRIVALSSSSKLAYLSAKVFYLHGVTQRARIKIVVACKVLVVDILPKANHQFFIRDIKAVTAATHPNNSSPNSCSRYGAVPTASSTTKSSATTPCSNVPDTVCSLCPHADHEQWQRVCST